MDIERKVEIIKEIAEEILTEDELRELFETNDHPVAYDGFEPSGIAPIHFGLLRATNLKNMLKAGIRFKLYLADYFGFINNKLGGDLEKIRKAGEYFIEVWKACGIDTKKVEIIWAKDIMDGMEYWDRVLRIAKAISIARSMRAITIMGRLQGEKLSTAQLMYPSMQVADIFHMDIDICQLGMDQRRAHVLAREVAKKYKWKKPIAVHHHILLGLQGLRKGRNAEETMILSKMSKSVPETCIYMHETSESLRKKINSAFCPPKQVEGNPILEYAKYIIFRERGSMFIERPSKYGGDIEYGSYEELENDYKKGNLHPQDLKNAVTKELDELIRPVREYFEKNKKAKELYENVKNIHITR
ncbi:MAG: tyrosine--tRNA ligase [Candidatus Micrarchaeota archaeon]|nr:tyrosine--tRNA ligase [Candidatus Micrarchaeota archaeon]